MNGVPSDGKLRPQVMYNAFNGPRTHTEIVSSMQICVALAGRDCRLLQLFEPYMRVPLLVEIGCEYLDRPSYHKRVT